MKRAFNLLPLFILITASCAQNSTQTSPTLSLPEPTPTLTSTPVPKATLNPPNYPLAQYGPHHVGKTSVIMKDPVDHLKDLEIGLYYPAIKPTDARGVLTLNGEPYQSEGPYPLILSSGKTASEFGTHLASHGFVVAGVTGEDSANTWGNWLVDYPRQIVSALDQLSKNPPEELQGIIDTNNAGAMGYSFDGYNALALGGARVDPEQFKQRCENAKPSEKLEQWWIEYICAPVQEWESFSENAGVEITTSNDGLWKPITDPRIRAVMPMAPEGAWLFGERGLAAVDRPVLIISATEDKINYYDQEAAYIYDNLGTKDLSMISFVDQGHMMIFDSSQVIKMKLFATAFFGDKLQGKSEFKEFYSKEFIDQYSDFYWGIYP